MALVDGGVAPDAGIMPSSIWLQGPSAVRQPRPSDPPLGPDRRFLEAAQTDGGVVSPQPFHPYAEAVTGFFATDGGMAVETITLGDTTDGGHALLPPLTLAIPVGPEQAEPTDAPPLRLAGHRTDPAVNGRAVALMADATVDKSGVDSVAAALHQTAGAWMSPRMRGAEGLTVRGMGGSRVLTLVDGVRMTNTAYGDGFSPVLATVDPYALEQLELHAGAAGVESGANAMGGVLLLSERGAAHGADVVIRSHGRAFFSSADQGRGLNAYGSGGMGPLSASVGGTLADAQDVRAGRGGGLQAETRHGDLHVQARTSLRLFGQELYGGFDAARRTFSADTALCRRPADGSDTRDCRLYDQLNRDLVYGGLRLWPHIFIHMVDVRFSWHHQDQQLARLNYRARRIDRMRDGVHAFDGVAYAESRELRIWRLAARVYAGGSVTHDTVESRFYRATMRGDLGETPGLGNEVPELSTLPDGAYDSAMAAWVAVHVSALDLFEVRAGARAAAHRLVLPASTRGPQAFEHLYPAGSAYMQGLVHVGSRAVLSGGLFHGYHPPNVHDLSAQTYTSLGFEYAQPEKQKLEHALSAEGRAALNLWRIKVSATAYVTRWYNAPTRVASTFAGEEQMDGAPVYQRVPGNDVMLMGGEATGDVRLLSHVHMGGTFTYVLAERVRSSLPLSNSPPPWGTLGVSYMPPLGFYARAMCRFVAPATRLSPQDKLDGAYDPTGSPQVVTFHMGGGYALNHRSGIDLWVENITDERYRLHGGAYQAAGINARAQLRFGF